MLNATALEKSIQVQSGGPTLDSTMWRRNGAGANDDKWRKVIHLKAHKVFLYHSWRLRSLIRKKKVLYNP